MPRPARQVWFVIVLLLPWVMRAQNPGGNSDTPSTPDDPLKFLEHAAKVNGLASDAARPWHVKASFQLLDDQGNVHESGSYEAFWRSPNRFKMSYSSPSYSRTIWANDSGTFATSDLKWPGNIEWMIRRSLFDLVPEPATLERSSLSWREISIGTKLNCVQAIPTYVKLRPLDIPLYCFGFGTPILRFGSEAHHRSQASFNSIVPMGKTFVAKDVQLDREGKPSFKLHITLLEPLSAGADELFNPDPGATRIPAGIVIDSDLRDIRAAYMVGIPDSLSGNRNAPSAASISPRFAKSLTPFNRDEQEVIVQVLVNDKGKVVGARPIQGDLRAQFKAVTAAKQWEFEPYLVHGEPTEFYTEIEF